MEYYGLVTHGEVEFDTINVYNDRHEFIDSVTGIQHEDSYEWAELAHDALWEIGFTVDDPQELRLSETFLLLKW